MNILENLWKTLRGDTLVEEYNRELEQKLQACQNGNRELNAIKTAMLAQVSSLNKELESERAQVDNLKIANAGLSTAYETQALEVDALRIALQNHPTSTTTLVDKENPKLLKLLTDPKSETVYRTGFGIYYNGTKYFYNFGKDCTPVHIGGVAFDHVLDTTAFRAGMQPKEVFDKALEIVQIKYGYKTDNDLYGPYDSWAPPMMTQVFSNGDCEDLAQYVVNIFLTYELIYGAFKEHYCGVGVGYMNGYCHAFPVLISTTAEDWKTSYIGEATLSSYQPSRTIESLKDAYIISLGVLGTPLKNNAGGGFVVRPEKQYWTAAAGAGPAQGVTVRGNQLEKWYALGKVWGSPPPGD